jgi:hypothetical protein
MGSPQRAVEATTGGQPGASYLSMPWFIVASRCRLSELHGQGSLEVYHRSTGEYCGKLIEQTWMGLDDS